ncbi:ER membrane protein complex subunit 8/9 [Entomortierella parvispora]|uniref:ER membrane protein complex subunit 8/9 n=1 Tax=Entomortierella parvispora TaxID=205924 RepID=A0A9P3M095_9FUNG|nr:ER membrane protein complex subunit 8/9 [Entomortierella parvispora]
MTIAHKAYLKPLLHAAKYPTVAVNGVLLAEQGSNKVVDAVPFFHFWNSLTPMLEVAMTQVDLYSKANGLRIIGYYEANERVDNEALSLVGQKIADQILKVEPEAFALVVKNENISSEEIAYIPYQYKEGQWRANKSAFSSPAFALENGSSPSLVVKSIREGLFDKLSDFDNHLENVQADWLANKDIVA